MHRDESGSTVYGIIAFHRKLMRFLFQMHRWSNHFDAPSAMSYMACEIFEDVNAGLN
jgi:hypothetical protein